MFYRILEFQRLIGPVVFELDLSFLVLRRLISKDCFLASVLHIAGPRRFISLFPTKGLNRAGTKKHRKTGGGFDYIDLSMHLVLKFTEFNRRKGKVDLKVIWPWNVNTHEKHLWHLARRANLYIYDNYRY